MKTEKNLISYRPNVLKTENPSQPCLEFPPCSNSLVKEPTAPITRYSRNPDFVRTEIRSLGKGRSKIAFTLAEILITLGIIGVVAALTMPSIIEKHRKQATLNRVKHTYALLNNALDRARVDYGDDITMWKILYDTSDKEKSAFWTERYLLPYLNTTVYSGKNAMNFGGYQNRMRNGTINGGAPTASSQSGVAFILNNGVYVYVLVGTQNSNDAQKYGDFSRIVIIFDIDGVKGKNTYGYDVFRLELGGMAGKQAYSTLAVRNKFLPYMYDSSKNCDYYLSELPFNHSCNKNGSGFGCLAYIMCNGWQIKDDYPW